MTNTEKQRLRRLLEYAKGYHDALLYVIEHQPYDDELELKIDIYFHKIDELQNKLSKNDK